MLKIVQELGLIVISFTNCFKLAIEGSLVNVLKVPCIQSVSLSQKFSQNLTEFWLNNYNAESHSRDSFSQRYTVKPAHAVTSIKQSTVLKGHLFLVLS